MRNPQEIKYYLDSDNNFVIENYNKAKPFSNFFPGIAGIWGIPMWVFYVNRGQCIASFGIESKNKSILEFHAANKAYRLTSLQGFRTLIKLKNGLKKMYYEPFQNCQIRESFETQQKMLITSHDLTIEEINSTLGLGVRVNYFTLPEEPFAGLIREVEVSNKSGNDYDMELIDGLPMIVPYGLTDGLLKSIPRTAEAWVKVNFVDGKVPYYRLNVEVSDTPAVKHISEGNFYFSFSKQDKQIQLLESIVESACVFGHCDDLILPESFLAEDNFTLPNNQQTSNRTPAALSFLKSSLKPNETKKITSVVGFAHSEEQLKKIISGVTCEDFIRQKAQRNKEVVEEIKSMCLTRSSSQELNLYASQSFLDNVLRGGLPISIRTSQGNVTFNVFSRKHGDMERDYNFFVLTPTYFSQGNGNYRDVNQNRRNDIWFNPDIQENSLINLLNFIQADGYNPLIVKGATFSVDHVDDIRKTINQCVEADGQKEIQDFLQNSFLIGDLLKIICQENVKLKVPLDDFLSRIISVCSKHESSEHGEGFWSDHWTYNSDLLESFLSIYPDRLKEILLGKKVFNFYHNSHYVLPRNQRYVLTENGCRQYHSVDNDLEMLQTKQKGDKLKIRNGQGSVYCTTLIVKLLCLIANKIASLDPSGIGVEMEADKPNWCDALNGLPGLLGSSISETFEIKRLCLFLREALKQVELDDNYTVNIFEELDTFISGLRHLLAFEMDPISYWRKSNDIKEHYRLRVRLGLDGQEKEKKVADIKKFLQVVIERIDKAIEAVKTSSGLFPTYFYHDVIEYEFIDKENSKGIKYVRPLNFQRHDLPTFLEGFVHALRIEKNQEKSRELYRTVKNSSLFDKKIKMYKVNTDLSGESEEIGRTRIFPPGWLENESIWLHMEYKFLLELLRCGLCEEFYEDFQNFLVPFLRPEQYGRSILENSSFIVSSVHKDENLHGQGFVARLSGSTAEFLHIWLLMNVGYNPFTLNAQKELCLQFKPILAGWLVTQEESTINWLDKIKKYQKITLPKDIYAFNFLGSTLVVYHNPKRKNTFGSDKAQIQRVEITYPNKKRPVTIPFPIIPAPHSYDIRDRKVEKIDVYLE